MTPSALPPRAPAGGLAPPPGPPPSPTSPRDGREARKGLPFPSSSAERNTEARVWPGFSVRRKEFAALLEVRRLLESAPPRRGAEP